MSLGENIKTIRKKWGESQEDFSARFGMKRSNLSKIETGEIEFSLQNCKQLSDLTGISMNRLMDELLTMEDIPPLPVGEGGERFLPDNVHVHRPIGSDLGEFADLRNMAAAVRDLQTDVDDIHKTLSGLEDADKTKLMFFKALQLVIEYLEKDLEESVYKEEKQAYLNRMAAILSGK